MRVTRRRVSTRQPARFPQLPYIASRLLYVGAVLLLLEALFPAAALFARSVEVYSSVLLPIDSAGLGTAAFLVILGAGLSRHKRVAWAIITLLFCCYSLILLAFVVIYAAQAIFAAPLSTGAKVQFAKLAISLPAAVFLTGVLIAFRGEFRARRRPGNVTRAVLTLVVGLLVTCGVGMILVTAFPGSLSKPRGRLAWLARQVLRLDVPAAGPHPPPSWTSAVVGLFASATLLAAMIVLTRSQARAAYLAPGDERRIRELLRDDPQDSLGYFATRRDKSVIYSLDGSAAITYRVQLGVCLASGDPVGPPDHWPAAVAAWVRMVREYGWTPAVLGASEDGATAYAGAGMRVIKLGDEAVLEPASFDLESPRLRSVAQAVRRLERAGYRVRLRRQSDIAADEMDSIVERAQAWRDTEDERGFSMALGRLGDPADDGCVLVEAVFPPGHPATREHDAAHDPVAGMLSFVPWGSDGLSLDVMRRHPEADNGVIELLVSRLLTEAADFGVRRVSLNFAVFRSTFEEGSRIGAGPLLRVWRRLLLAASRWWQIESLYRANVKYQPVWKPRFFCYAEAGDMALVGLASGVAEGFIDLPAFVQRPETPPLTSGEPRGLPAAPAEPAQPTHRLPEQVRQRSRLRTDLLSGGIDPYPAGFRPADECADLVVGADTAVAGRVSGIRDHGGVIFVTVRDRSGAAQLMLTRDAAGGEEMNRFRARIGLGDHVGVRGPVTTSRTGTVSVSVHTWLLTGKALRPMPDKYRGLTEPEARIRQPYLDLASNRAARDRLRDRSAAIQAVRDGLRGHDFWEVDTPILQSVHGGANARPFRTHMNTGNLDLYLRIAPELHLKRLMVGGLDRVFEIGRNFRNEGADATHNPEFTMVEAYRAYADYNTMRDLCQTLVRDAARAATGASVITGTDHHGRSRTVDLAQDWPVITVHDAVSAAVDAPVTPDTERAELVDHARRSGVPADPGWDRDAVLMALYEQLVEDRTVAPTFYSDFPVAVSPLTRRHRADSRLAERWDLVCFGAEIATAYTELTDPVEQRDRLTAQSVHAAGGDPEAMELDEDFLTALEHGMPPTGGLGMGLDRLVMMLTGTSIRDTITFPLVRPKRVPVNRRSG